MRRRLLIGPKCAATVTILIAASSQAAIPCGYEVSAVIQGPFCGILGYPPTRALGISEDGGVVGFYSACTAGPKEAYVWTPQLDQPLPACQAARRVGPISPNRPGGVQRQPSELRFYDKA